MSHSSACYHPDSTQRDTRTRAEKIIVSLIGPLSRVVVVVVVEDIDAQAARDSTASDIC